ncbi:MAG: hypothetical protein U9O94_05375, partial [Nanoarchaeota archaeon]|nr:hypothetical protein [Nanoarchaeota archaeon]
GKVVANRYCSEKKLGKPLSFEMGVGAKGAGGTYKYTSTGGYHKSDGDAYFSSIRCAGAVKCSKESDCGTDGWVGKQTCHTGSKYRIYQTYKTYTCNNPGTPQSSCSVEERYKFKMECPNGCDGDACKAACSSNADCGEEKWVRTASCFDGNVRQQYRTYTCNNPGTSSSSCTPKEEFKLKESCEAGCSGGKCTVAAAPIPSGAPKTGGYLIDWCHRSAGCGKVVANRYCSEKKLGKPLSFEMGVGAKGAGGTYKYTSTGGYHDSGGDAYFMSITCGEPEEEREPITGVMVNGYPLHDCIRATGGINLCGQKAADMYCRRKNKGDNALNFTIAKGASKKGGGNGTYMYLKGYSTLGFICSSCDTYFKEIECSYAGEKEGDTLDLVPDKAVKVNNLPLDCSVGSGSCGQKAAEIYCDKNNLGQLQSGSYIEFTGDAKITTYQYTSTTGRGRTNENGKGYYDSITCGSSDVFDTAPKISGDVITKRVVPDLTKIPKINGYPIDYISHRCNGPDCGIETANLYCKLKGKGIATENTIYVTSLAVKFQTYRYTNDNGQGTISNNGDGFFFNIECSEGGDVITNPKVNNLALNYCSQDSKNGYGCGKITADIYCQREEGRAGASSYVQGGRSPSEGSYRYYLDKKEGYKIKAGYIISSITCTDESQPGPSVVMGRNDEGGLTRYPLDAISHKGSFINTAEFYCGKLGLGKLTGYAYTTGAKQKYGGTYKYTSSTSGKREPNGNNYFTYIACESGYAMGSAQLAGDSVDSRGIQAVKVNNLPLDCSVGSGSCGQKAAEIYCDKNNLGQLQSGSYIE